MASDLTPAERDDREAERLINKKRPPSRKRAEKRGPKYDNRRRRMKDKDKSDTAKQSSILDLNTIALSIIQHSETSNETILDKAMSARSATYHGVIQQGHPSGPTNTGYRSIDKRYLGNDHYESILKFAKGLLEEDWLKYDWEGGASDAKFRAALDLSIHLADQNLYQSKIDAETYDLLLNRLAGWGHNSFSETVYPTEKKRSASTMSQEHVRNIVRVASDLRNTDPKAAFEIIKNLRALVSSEASAGQSISKIAQQQEQEEEEEEQQGQQQGQQGQQQGQQQQGQQQEESERCGQQEQQGQQQEQGQQQQGIGPHPKSLEFKSLTDEDFKKIKEEAKKLFNAKDIEEFMAGFDKLHEGLEEHKKTASLEVPISLIVRMAAANPALRAEVRPLLIAAKKKLDKKKGKKKPAKKDAPKGKGKKAPPFGGKKAPPFGGKKAPPFGGKKASLNIASDDLNW